MAHPSTRSVEALLGHEPWLRDLASRLARPGTEADDLVQDTWLSVLKRPLRGDPRGWLYRVTTNAARLDRRTGARRRARELDHEQLHASPAVDEVHADLEIHRVLLDELDELEEPYRTVLALRFLEGKSLSAVATRLDVPRDTVKSQQARGIERLRRRLDRRMGDRGQWMTALVPLLPSRSTIWTLLMIPSSKVVVAAVMITGLVALLAYGRRDVTELPFPDGATDPQRSASERGASIASEGPSTSQSRREQAAPSSPASSDPAAGDRVTGQVVDHTGSPLSGVRVHEVRDTTHFVTTDARGEFTWPDPDEPVELTPSGPDLWAVTTRWVRPGDPDPLRLVLAPAIHLAGRVVDEVGRPLERATLHVRLPDAWSRDLEGGTYGATKRGVFAGCDGLGRFDMQEVPAVPEALIWVEHGERSAVFSMPLASNLSLELRLVQVSEDQRWATVPHLTGRVTDGIGQPVENVRVVTEHFYSDSAADGTFRFPLSCLARAQSLSLVRRGHVPSEVARPGPRWPDHLELRIDDRPVSAISGRLVDHEGRPLADRKVWILEGAQLRPGLESSCLEEEVGAVHDRTDQEGRFSLTALPEQLYRVAAFDRESWTRVESRRVPAGTNQLELVVSEPPSPLTLRGRLVDRDGSPVAGAKVTPQWTIEAGTRAWSFSGGLGTTDEQGRFHIPETNVGFDSLDIEGPGVMPQSISADGQRADQGDLVLARRARVRVRTSIPDAGHFVLLDELGEAQPVYLFQWIGNGTIEGSEITSWPEIEGGGSATYTAPEGRYEVALYSGELEVRRARVMLKAGEVTLVEFD